MKYSAPEATEFEARIRNIYFAQLVAEGNQAEAEKITAQYSLDKVEAPRLARKMQEVCAQKDLLGIYNFLAIQTGHLNMLREEIQRRNAQPETRDEAQFLQNIRDIHEVYEYLTHAAGYLWNKYYNEEGPKSVGPDSLIPMVELLGLVETLSKVIDQTKAWPEPAMTEICNPPVYSGATGFVAFLQLLGHPMTVGLVSAMEPIIDHFNPKNVN